MEHKFCHKCGRAVKETIHTQEGWKNDYFSKVKDGKATHTCVDCIKKDEKKK